MKDHHNSKQMAGALILTAFLAALFLLIAAYGPGARLQTASAQKISNIAPAHETEIETPHPEGTETHQPEATETQHAEGTRTPEAEPTETHHPEGTETPEVEPTETHHAEGTRTPEVEPTETHHAEGTRTPEVEPTRTHMPSPVPTGQAPIPAKQPIVPASVPGTGVRTFSETGKSVQGIFLQYWEAHGGLLQQGLPISNVMQEKSDTDGKVYAVQYFERATFEYHPELAANKNVLLSLLGSFRYNSKYPAGAPNQVVNKSGATYFPQTGHYVGGTFLKYWQEHGGLAQQGYPLSDEMTEVSPLDGKTYTVQYFERAVFELHPENKAPYNVLLSQLGTFRYTSKYNGK